MNGTWTPHPSEVDYRARADALEQGQLPDDADLPFYAHCMGGSFEIDPLGYADYQGAFVVGYVPLVIKLGHTQSSSEGVSVGHWVLLQSWLPITRDLAHQPWFLTSGADSDSSQPPTRSEEVEPLLDDTEKATWVQILPMLLEIEAAKTLLGDVRTLRQ